MANVALYRKYRSRTFAEIIGQEHVTEPLAAALRNGRLNHAYLFSGPRGCGKTSSARILARSVNCEKGPTPEPCGECESCRALAPDGGGSIDVIEIDAASHGGVDDARELREKAFFAPVSSRFKVYVIDEAHMVSSQGFNALLKLVEEPPEYVMFVFATTEPDKVLGTIKSRTHHYPFRLVPPGVMRTHLERVCDSEGIQVDPAVFPLVVRAGGGSVRDSLSILDQLLAGADDEGVTYQHALALLGVTDAGLIDEACEALAAAHGGTLFGTIDKVVEAGHEPRRFASDLLDRLRDLIVLNQVPDAVSKGLLDVPPDEVERLTGQALRLGSATLARMADILHQGLAEMRGTAAPRLVLELLCARMLLPGDESTIDLLQRMERLEHRFDVAGAPAAQPTASAPATPAAAPGSGAQPSPGAAAPKTHPAPPAPASAPASTAAPAPASAPAPAAEQPRPHDDNGPQASAATEDAPTPDVTPAAGRREPAGPSPDVTNQPATPGQVDIGAVTRHWETIVENTKRRRVVWSLLQNAAPFGLDGDTLVLKARNAGIAGRFNDESIVAVVQEALLTVLGVKWRIRCQANPTPPRGGPGSVPGGPGPEPGGPRQGPGHPPAAATSSPGGSSTPRASAAAQSPPEADGWPEITRPGGDQSPAADHDRPAVAALARNGSPAGGPAMQVGNPAPAAVGTVQAAAAPGPVTVTSAAPAAPAVVPPPVPGQRPQERPAQQAAPADSWPEGPTDFSPDDPIPPALGGYDQFAPGDEPLDEPLDPSKLPPTRTLEDEALSLLKTALGAEIVEPS